MSIRLLPQTLINQIAAGEVVERPASALKELMENAIDAGASKIEITMIDGGKTYFSVKDDGKGMSPEELDLAVERHATSKLPDENLFNINFLGFRGEALPSIASVSKLKITSRTAESSEAWCICVNGGHKETVKPTAFGKGTLVEVNDLFYATPARLKFLKTPQTEMGYAKEIVNRLAMAYPKISFSLSDGKRTCLNYSKTDNLLTRVSQVIGKDFDKNAVSVDAEYNGMKLFGFVGLPTYLRATSTEQYLFVNGRFVKDKVLIGAIRGAFQGLIGHGNEGYPVLSLFLQVPNQDVDVNVHPAKTEVRFKDAASVRGLLVGSIRRALTENASKTSSMIGDIALSKSTPSILPKRQHSTEPSYITPILPQISQPMMAMDIYSVKKDEPTFNIADIPQMPTLNTVNVSNGKAAQTHTETQQTDFPPLGFAKAQLHETYIVSQTMDSIIITDQHAAHERLTYEKMMAIIGTNPKTQLLLIPEIIDLNQSEVDVLVAWKDELGKMGLVLDAFGYDSIAVREIPAILDKTDIKNLIQDLADTLKEFGDTVALQDKIKDICARMACHSSIRSGRKLTIEEMNALLRQMEGCGTSGQCIHGRPTYVELKLNDIERLFGRK